MIINKFRPKVVDYTMTNHIGEEICLVGPRQESIKISKTIDEIKVLFTGEIIAKKQSRQNRTLSIESFRIIRKNITPDDFKLKYDLVLSSKMLDILTSNSKTYNLKNNTKIIYKIDFSFTKEGAKVQLRNKLVELEDKFIIKYSKKCKLEMLK